MKRILRTAVAVKLSALLLAIAAPTVASAATEAYIDCSLQTNACFGYATSDSGPVNFTYEINHAGVDAIFPADCTNDYACRFYCWRSPGPLTARVIAYDANYNIVATSEWVTGLCTQQDILLPDTL